MKTVPKNRNAAYLLLLITLLLSFSSCTMPEQMPLENNQTTEESLDISDGDIVAPVQIWEVSFTLAEQDKGLKIIKGGDVDWENVTIGDTDQHAFRSGNGEALPSPDSNTTPDHYIQFNIDDAVIYQGSPTSRVIIEVDYLDVGTDTFNIQYDGQGGPFLDTAGIVKTDSGEIKTTPFFLCDANFGNRTNGDDFRISDGGDGADTFTRISIKLIEASNSAVTREVDSCGANPFDDLPDSDAIQACLNQMCSGDTVVFTSPGRDAAYQGYLLDKTIFLMLTGAKSDLTFTSSDENDHALLKATAEMKGFVVQLYSKAWIHNPGLIDDIHFVHLDVDGNREERLCVGPDGYEGGGDDNYGSWQPECTYESDIPGDTDPWCSAGGLGMNGGFAPFDLYQEFESNPEYWSTGLEVRDVVISNVECGTALGLSGAAGTIAEVTVDTAGDHVHVPGCKDTDLDGEYADWSDGITLIGPEMLIENNTVINPTDIGIVHFGGRGTIIRNNTVIVEQGNNGAFAGINLGANWFGINGDYEISGNTVINNSDTRCGGIHAGIYIGLQMWGGACNSGTPAATGNIGSCSADQTPPGENFCGENQDCQIWTYVPEGTTLTLTDNTVTGAQINFLIGGAQFEGNFIESGNISKMPHDTDWEGANGCYTFGTANSWGIHDFVAFNPSLPGWTELEVYCER